MNKINDTNIPNEEINNTNAIQDAIQKTAQSKNKVHIAELTGTIEDKKKIVNKEGVHVGSYYWELNVKIVWPEKATWVRKLLAFKERIDQWGDPQVWKDIENANYVQKKYTFFCTRYRLAYRLLRWQEIK